MCSATNYMTSLSYGTARAKEGQGRPGRQFQPCSALSCSRAECPFCSLSGACDISPLHLECVLRSLPDVSLGWQTTSIRRLGRGYAILIGIFRFLQHLTTGLVLMLALPTCTLRGSPCATMTRAQLSQWITGCSLGRIGMEEESIMLYVKELFVFTSLQFETEGMPSEGVWVSISGRHNAKNVVVICYRTHRRK